MGDVLIAALGAVAGILAAAVTAFFTARRQSAHQINEWRKEIALKYVDLATTDREKAQVLARQFAVGLLVVEGDPDGREKVFVPPNCRLTAGRGTANDVVIADQSLSRQHVAFSADDARVYVEDLGSANGTWLLRDGVRQRVQGRTNLLAGDHVDFGGSTFVEFQPLS